MKKVKFILTIVLLSAMFINKTYGQEKEVQQEAEILYTGITTLEKCDSVKVTFILSADKKTVKDFSIHYYGIYYRHAGSNEIKKITGESSFPHTEEIINGSVNKKYEWQYPKWHLQINGLTTDKVTGTFNCIYNLPGNTIVDLGTSTIIFKKAE
jgi:hypothetical protein